MASNSWSAKGKIPGSATSLKITPANSPILRPGTRSPSKPSPHQSALTLQTVIGTTTATPNGFSSHESSKSFALCVGSAAILAQIETDGTVNQRFFRARPTASPVNPVVSFYNQPASSPVTPDNRYRSISNRAAASGGLTPSADWTDGSTSRTWSSRERIKAVTSVAISPNGRFLAIGETGYNPRVSIFSTAADAPHDVPLTMLTEHSFGVRSLAFSSDSQYLATLGDMNDGFLFVWAINLRTGAAKLHSTNKCTSFIRDMCWMGQTLITAGIRHVKVWRLDAQPGSPSKLRPTAEPLANPPNTSPKALSGRNCVLGPLGDHTFTCIATISDSEAILCTDSGAVCFLDDSENSQKLTVVKYVPFGLTSVTLDSESGYIWLGGRGRKSLKLHMDSIRESLKSRSPSPNTSTEMCNPKTKVPTFISMAYLTTHIITVDSTRAIHVCPVDTFGSDDEDSLKERLMPAHRDPILGVKPLKSPNLHEADFFTWSCEGTVHFWNVEGKCRASRKVEIEQLSAGEDEAANELKVLRVTEDMNTFVSGDRYGVLRILSANPWKCINEARAHGSEVTDIVIQSVSGICLIASSGRDRMVQLFKKTDETFELIQTMDDHVGAVGGLLFMNDGERLLSCSADRTVIVREKASREFDGSTTIAYLMSKVITLKVSPISMTLAPDDPDTLVLSTMDRHIQRFDVSSGRHIHSFKATDSEAIDAVVMGSLTVASEIPGQSPRLLVGVSTTDKSIRVYDLERDTLLTKEFGHSEGVSDVIMLDTKKRDSTSEVTRTLVSTGLDGVVMIWSLSVQQQQVQELSQGNLRDEEETPVKELTATKPPLRRILSRSELAGFRQDNPLGTPTPVREPSPPRIRKKTSRYTLAPPITKNGGFTRGDSPPPLSNIRRSVAPVFDPRRSPSPPSPKSKVVNGVNHRSSMTNLRRPSIDFRSSRTKSSAPSEFGSLNMSTEQVCRTLRAYRKKLHGTSENPRCGKELERELQLTVNALEERAKRHSLTPDTENDSSGKENHERRLITGPTPSKPTRAARRVPSTPLLSKAGPSKTSRSRSWDADGEG